MSDQILPWRLAEQTVSATAVDICRLRYRVTNNNSRFPGCLCRTVCDAVWCYLTARTKYRVLMKETDTCKINCIGKLPCSNTEIFFLFLPFLVVVFVCLFCGCFCCFFSSCFVLVVCFFACVEEYILFIYHFTYHSGHWTWPLLKIIYISMEFAGTTLFVFKSFLCFLVVVLVLLAG